MTPASLTMTVAGPYRLCGCDPPHNIPFGILVEP